VTPGYYKRPDATAALVRRRLGARISARPDDRADAQLGRDWHASTGGNPFLLEALAVALRDGDQKAEPIAQAVLRRIGPEGPEAGRLTRALAVLGGPAPLRQAAALAGLDLPAAARLADSDYVDVQISLDGATADVNDAVRGEGSWATAVAAMDNLAAAGVTGFKISVVATRHNIGQLDEFKALTEPTRVREILDTTVRSHQPTPSGETL